MKKLLLFTILLLLGLGSNLSYGQYLDFSPTGFYDDCNYTGSGNNTWTYYTGGNGTISQSQSAGAIHSVCTNINTNVLVTAELLTTPINLTNVAHQKLNVRLKSTVAIVLNLQVSEGGGINYKLNWGNLPVIVVPGDNTYHDYAINFSGNLAGGANMAAVNEIGFIYFGASISPTVSIDYIDVGNYPGPTLAACLTKTSTFLTEAGCRYSDYPNYTWGSYVPSGGPSFGGGSVAIYQGQVPAGSIAYDITGLYAGTESPSIAAFDITSGSPGINLSSTCSQKYFVRLKSTIAIPLYLQMRDENMEFKLNWGGPTINVPGDNTYHDYNLDFSTFIASGVNMANVGNVFLFYPGTTPLTGTITVDSMSLGSIAESVTTAASGINLTNITPTSMTINWTNGTGSARIVQVGYSGLDAPVDGATYTANSVYGLGSDITSLGYNFIVYNGTGNSVTVTGLDASSIYSIGVYEYNTVTCGPNYKTDAIPSITRYPVASEPVSGASGINFSGVTLTSMNVNWTNGTGSKRIVIAKQGSAVDQFPSDFSTTSYTANTVFGSGTNLGGGNFIVYDGTSSSFNLTGLIASTNYYFAVVEYNDNFGTFYTRNYRLTSPPTGNQATLTSEPTVAASSILFSNVTTTSMDLSWTNGNGARRIVLARASSAVGQLPIDYTSYTAATSFGVGTDLGGSNFVVYDGTGSTFSLTGLTLGTTYHFSVFEYNGLGVTANYYTAIYPTGNQATSSGAVTEPTTAANTISFTAVTSSSFTINWVNGNGSNRLVLVKQGSTVDASPSDNIAYTVNTALGSGSQIGTGNYVVYTGSGNSVAITGLNPSTTYHVSVFEFNGSGATANFLVAGAPVSNQTTSAGAITEPTSAATSLIFSSVTATSFTINWTNGNGAGRMVVVKQSSAVDTDPSDNTAYTANSAFTSGTQIGTGNYVVFVGTGNSVSVTGLTASTTYHVEIYEFNGSGATSNFLTSSSLVGSQATSAAVAAEPTVAASSLSFSAITATSFTINWTNGNGAGRMVVLKQGSAVDTDPTDNTAYTANTAFTSGTQIGTGNYVVFIGTGNSVAVTGLTASTTYHVEIYEFNGSGATSNFLTSSSLIGNQATNAVPTGEPTTPSSNITFSSVNTFSMTVSWTSGNGAGRVVVVHQDSPVTTAPSDNNGYATANSNIALAPSLGGGNFVVYNGTGSSVTVTGLASGTTYYFSIYEYNGSGATADYLTSTFATNNESTTAVTSVNTAKETESIALYPNPNTGNVQINLSSIANATQIQIINDMGLVIRTIELVNGTGILDINTSDLSSGIYLLTIKKSDNTQFTKKMVRN